MTNYEQVRNVKKPSAATQKQQQPSRRTDPGLTRQQHPAAILQRATAAPESLTTADVLQLQRTIGNRAVGQLLSGIGAGRREPTTQGSLIQAKLTINPPGDVYEQEADRVAGQVVDRINQPASQPAGPGQAVQRQPPPEEEELLQGKMIQRQPEEEEEELLQGKMIDTIQRQDIPEEEEALQMMPAVQRAPDGGIAAAPDLEAAIQRARGSGQPLSRGIRAPMEQAFGADFGGVRVHTDTESDTLNRSIQARAFTTGQDVFFRQGAYDPGSRGGKELLAHELTHVVQQNERVSMRHDRLNVVDKFDDGAGLINRSVYTPGIPAITSVISRTQRSVIQPAYTAKRPLSGMPFRFLKLYHIHIFFEDKRIPANIGFMGPEGLGPDNTHDNEYTTDQKHLGDLNMRKAVKANDSPGTYDLVTNNCQKWVKNVLETYNTLKKNQ